MKWKASDIPDLKGKIAIVTGANSGIGFQTSLALARKNAMVIMAVRSREKGLHAAEIIHAEVPNAELVVMKVDLANIESVKHFADGYLEEFQRLDILINNAGVMALPLMHTAQGFEIQLGTNHLGHFVLTALLIDILSRTANSRIVNVSSLAYKIGKVSFDDINYEKSYSRLKAYAQSKLSNLLFTMELDRKLRLSGKSIIVSSAHPGYAKTNLHARAAEIEGAGVIFSVIRFANYVFGQKASKGALPVLYAATSPNVKSTGYYGPDGIFSLYGYPTEEYVDSKYVVPMDAVKLWDLSEKLTGIKFTI